MTFSAWLATIDLTETLAVLQTVAGFGAILAAILLPIWQVERSRIAERERVLAFIRASSDLVAEISQGTDICRQIHDDLGPRSPVNHVARVEWRDNWMHGREALKSLRDRAPPDARIMMILTRCIAALELGENTQFIQISGDMSLRLRGIIDRLAVELTALQRLTDDIRGEIGSARPRRKLRPRPPPR